MTLNEWELRTVSTMCEAMDNACQNALDDIKCTKTVRLATVTLQLQYQELRHKMLEELVK